MSLKILGAGMAHPTYALTNAELSEMVDTNDEWITTRTGIKSRYITTTGPMLNFSVAAARKALQESKLEPHELDLIICTTIQGDYITPSLACEVQLNLGAVCPAFDINAACTGFIYALDVAKSYFDSGRAKNILIVSSEQMTKFVNWKDRETCVLFGDGSGAVVVTKGEDLKAIKITAKGDKDLLYIPGCAGSSPFMKDIGKEQGSYLHMQGKEVFKFAVHSMCDDITDVLKEAGLGIEDITTVIPHQANIRIINSAAAKLGIREDQLVIGVDKYGNTSSSSIPMLLGELIEFGDIKEGDIIVLSAFGGGLTSGACVLKI